MDNGGKQKKVFKNEIKYSITLNEEQKEVKRLIHENQIVIITGRAGCGKSLVSAQTALDFLFKKEIDAIYVTRAAVEVGHSLGFLPGSLDEKFNPYLEAFQENLIKCYDKAKIIVLLLVCEHKRYYLCIVIKERAPVGAWEDKIR